MSSTNGGPSVTTTPNYVSQSAPAGSASVPFDPSSVAITGGTIAKGLTAPQTGNKIAMLGNSIVAQNVPTGSGDAGWASATPYSASTFASPSAFDLTNGAVMLRYQVTTAGTSGSIEPIWPTSVGGTVQDGGVTWTAVAATNGPRWNTSWWHLAQALSGQRLNEVYIVGRSGQQSADILQYVNRALAANPDIVYFANMLENDVVSGATSLASITASWAAVAAAMDRVRSLGKRVMTQTLFPSGSIDASSLFTGYSRGNGSKAWQWLNAQIRDYARARPDVILFDAAYLYVDTNPANPVWPENTTSYLSPSGSGQQLKKTDGIHPNTSAAWIVAQALAPVLAANFPAVSHFGTASDLNYASVNPLNFGTAGTAGTGITSGTPANLMQMFAFGTVTSAVLSQVARTDIAGSWQQCAYNATAGGAVQYQTSSSVPLGNFAVGDVVQGFAEIKLLANPTLVSAIGLQVSLFSGTPNSTLAMVSSGSGAQDLGQFVTADTIFTMKTVPMAIPAGTTGMQPFVTATGRGASTFTAQFGQLSINRVLSNPALA